MDSEENKAFLTFLFLLAWVDGSDSAGGESTKVHEQSDLYLQFKQKNEHVFALIIKAPNATVAKAFGYSTAFFNDYTAHDSVSICMNISNEEYYELDNNIRRNMRVIHA